VHVDEEPVGAEGQGGLDFVENWADAVGAEEPTVLAPEFGLLFFFFGGEVSLGEVGVAQVYHVYI